MGTEITATFTADGKLTGSAGCNTYTSTYQADAGTISIAEPVTTRMSCPEPKGVMEQEQAFLSALALTRALQRRRPRPVAADGGRHVHGDLRAGRLRRVPAANASSALQP